MTAYGLTLVTVEDFSGPNPDDAVRAEGLPVLAAQRMKSKLQKPIADTKTPPERTST